MPPADKDKKYDNVRFGNYLITGKIGEGGMAEVLKARVVGAQGFQKVICIKRVHRRYLDDRHFVDMFVNEAKIAARLSHQNIVQVFDLGELDGEFFMAMEYIPGRDLLQLIQAAVKLGAPPPAPVSAHVAREICRALAYAHDFVDENGDKAPIIHRDVSPQNILISFDGAIKICDFGLAKAAQSSGARTRTGVLKGKFGYLAPEQLESVKPGPASDLWATGVVLWESLTGKRLFRGTSDFDTLMQVKSKEVPRPSELNPAVAPELDRIVGLALQRNPAQRYQRAAQMARDLDLFCAQAGFAAEDMKEYMAGLFPDELRPGRSTGEMATAPRAGTPAPGPAPTAAPTPTPAPTVTPTPTPLPFRPPAAAIAPSSPASLDATTPTPKIDLAAESAAKAAPEGATLLDVAAPSLEMIQAALRQSSPSPSAAGTPGMTRLPGTTTPPPGALGRASPTEGPATSPTAPPSRTTPAQPMAAASPPSRRTPGAMAAVPPPRQTPGQPMTAVPAPAPALGGTSGPLAVVADLDQTLHDGGTGEAEPTLTDPPRSPDSFAERRDPSLPPREMPKRRRQSPGLGLALGAAALIIAGGLGFVLYQRQQNRATAAVPPPLRPRAAAPSPPPEPAAPTRPEPAAPTQPAAAPTLTPLPTLPTISLRVETTPPGAEVTEGPRIIGTTPFELKFPPGREAVPIRVRLAGFKDLSYTVRSADAPRVSLRLTPTHRSH